MTERELLLQYQAARKHKDELTDQLKDAQAAVDGAETQLMEYLESKAAVATAKYEGVGYARIEKPRLYANCRNDDQEKLFEFLRAKQREDLIRTVVNNAQLSSFVRECLAEGVKLPEFITYYLKPKVKLYT